MAESLSGDHHPLVLTCSSSSSAPQPLGSLDTNQLLNSMASRPSTFFPSHSSSSTVPRSLVSSSPPLDHHWPPLPTSLQALLTASSSASPTPSLLGQPQFVDYVDAVGAGSERKRPFYSCFEPSEDGIDDDPTDRETQQSPAGDKKTRRLGFEQVKALEKAFDIENRLEPERKVRLAAQLGLQPRQVAVWFQNRRARWKTKQMERDYGVLKNKFETLKADWEDLMLEKEKLQDEVARLKEHPPTEISATDRNSPPLPAGLEDRTNLALGKCEDSVLAKANSSDHKENDCSFSSTDVESDDGAIVDSNSPRRNAINRIKAAVLRGEPEDDQNMVPAEASENLDNPDFYNWRLASSDIANQSRGIKSKEWEVGEEDERTDDEASFVSLEWCWT